MVSNMEKIRFKKLLNNKGIAIESVMFAMIVILMLCTLLVFISLRFSTMSRFNKDSITDRLYLDQIADDYLNHINNNSEFDDSNYTYKDGDVEKAYVISKPDVITGLNSIDFKVSKINEVTDENGNSSSVEETLLSVIYTLDNNKYIVTKWSYGE